MDAVKFFKEARRLCNTLKNCSDCPLCNCICGLQYDEVTDRSAAKTIDIVEKWALENPEKTRQSEFLKIFPSAAIEFDHLDICPHYVQENYEPEGGCEIPCEECKKAYWLAEAE